MIVLRDANGASGAWTSARTSTDTGPPSKLAHSRSWQTIRTGSSFNRYLDGESSSDSASQPTVTGEEAHLASSNFDYRSLLRRSKNVLSSALASSNRFKTMPDLAPKNMKKEMSPLSAVSHSSWMKLDNRAGKSFSSLKSSNMSSYTLPLLSDQHQFKENTEDSAAQKPLIARKSKTFGVAQSKIASLRQIFDRPRSTTTSPITSAKTKRRATTPISMASTPNKPRRLQKSATVQMLGSTESLKIKTTNIDNAITSLVSQIPNSATVSLPKKDSPLKEKIGLFESLARESCDGSPRSTRSKKVTQEKPFLQNYRRKISGVKKSFQIKGTLRRLSASWRTSSEDNEVCETKPQDATKPKDAWWMRRDLAVIKKAPRPQLSPRAAEINYPPTSPTNKERSKAKAAGLKKDSHAFRDTKCISKRWSMNDQGFNVDGEGGGRSKGKQLFKHDNSPIPVPAALSLSKSASYSMDNNASDRPLSPSTAPTGQKTSGTHSLFRRRTSRSSGPFVANVYCKLEQPKPVRAGEMRRIISLCKDKVTRRVSGGGYE